MDGSKKFVLALSFIFILSSLVGSSSLGCRTLPAKPAEPAISYHLVEGVDLAKLTFYLKVPRDLPYPVCWVDVTVRNRLDSEQSYLVLVQVDDEPGVALRTKKPLGPKKEETLTLITMSQNLPQRFSLTITR